MQARSADGTSSRNQPEALREEVPGPRAASPQSGRPFQVPEGDPLPASPRGMGPGPHALRGLRPGDRVRGAGVVRGAARFVATRGMASLQESIRVRVCAGPVDLI